MSFVSDLSKVDLSKVVFMVLCMALLSVPSAMAVEPYPAIPYGYSVAETSSPVETSIAVCENGDEVTFFSNSTIEENGKDCATLKLVADDGHKTQVVGLVPSCGRKAAGESIEAEYVVSKLEIQHLMTGFYYSVNYTNLTATVKVVNMDTAKEYTESRTIKMSEYP